MIAIELMNLDCVVNLHRKVSIVNCSLKSFKDIFYFFLYFEVSKTKKALFCLLAVIETFPTSVGFVFFSQPIFDVFCYFSRSAA